MYLTVTIIAATWSLKKCLMQEDEMLETIRCQKFRVWFSHFTTDHQHNQQTTVYILLLHNTAKKKLSIFNRIIKMSINYTITTKNLHCS